MITITIIILLIMHAVKMARLKRSIVFTRQYCNKDIGYITYVCGTVGAGKTTLACGITNNLNLTLIEKAEKTIKNFTTIFYDYDFNNAYKIINEKYHSGITNSESIAKFILAEPEYSKLGNMKYSNYLDDKISVFKMLTGVVEAVLALERNNYVYYYNCGFYSHITGKYALNFEPSMIDIKDRAKAKDYQINSYSIIFEDEKQISNKISTNFQTFAKEDGGSDLFLRLIRQLGKGTIYYITTSQEFGRAVKVERMLATSILYITKRKVVNPYYIQNLLLNVGIFFLESCLSLKNLMLGRQEPKEYFYKSKLKKMLFRCQQRKRYYFANSFIEYSIIKYNNAEDVGRRIDLTTYGGEALRLTFPLIYCFGSIDTNAFSVIQDYLVKSSKKKPEAEQESPEKFAKKVLTKTKKEPKKAKPKKKSKKQEIENK